MAWILGIVTHSVAARNPSIPRRGGRRPGGVEMARECTCRIAIYKYLWCNRAVGAIARDLCVLRAEIATSSARIEGGVLPGSTPSSPPSRPREGCLPQDLGHRGLSGSPGSHDPVGPRNPDRRGCARPADRRGHVIPISEPE